MAKPKREKTAEELAQELEFRKLVFRDTVLEAGMDTYFWVMPVPDKVWSGNERLHYRPRAKRVKAWRVMARLQAEYLRSTQPLFPLEGRWEVELCLPFIRGGRRDLSNYVGTVVKSVVDGLVDAGVWADDDGRHVRVMEPTWVKQNPQATVSIKLDRLAES